jgi:hypothetical protein
MMRLNLGADSFVRRVSCRWSSAGLSDSRVWRIVWRLVWIPPAPQFHDMSLMGVGSVGGLGSWE